MAHVATAHKARVKLFLRMPLLGHCVAVQKNGDPFERANTLKPDKPKEAIADWRIFMQSNTTFVSCYRTYLTSMR